MLIALRARPAGPCSLAEGGPAVDDAGGIPARGGAGAPTALKPRLSLRPRGLRSAIAPAASTARRRAASVVIGIVRAASAGSTSVRHPRRPGRVLLQPREKGVRQAVLGVHQHTGNPGTSEIRRRPLYDRRAPARAAQPAWPARSAGRGGPGRRRALRRHRHVRRNSPGPRPSTPGPARAGGEAPASSADARRKACAASRSPSISSVAAENSRARRL